MINRIERQIESWMNLKEAAAYLGLSTPTVHRHIRRRGLPVHRIGPRVLRFRRSELDAWVASQERGR